ncbi:hypothetical protein M9Y10_041570 [Tritrichomonas musculus]|uniref:Uncharacterized protein n=1 Tax=Tritrichomonas musculus TaxID=1915356 RepID=A0ABR2K4P1_9EUKA
MGNFLSSFCCFSQVNNNDGEPTFTNEDNVIPEAKRASDQDVNDTSQHDGTPLLKTSATNLVTATDSSDGSYNAEVIDEMLKEIEEDEKE